MKGESLKQKIHNIILTNKSNSLSRDSYRNGKGWG